MKNYRLHISKKGLSHKIVKFFALLLFTFCSFSEHRQKRQANEYNLKAAFIYNFTRYIEWKAAEDENEFIIGVIGASPINNPLAEIVKTEMVDNKKITIKQFNKPADISDCHILFISQKSSVPLEDILAKTNKGTLIISEQDGYAEHGAAINFVVVNHKLKFEANVKAINAAGLTASSQLLKLAIIVK